VAPDEKTNVGQLAQEVLMDKVERALDSLHNSVDALALSPTDFGVFDDNDMIAFALGFLEKNLTLAFASNGMVQSQTGNRTFNPQPKPEKKKR
jgi:hypothetical protein